MNYKLRDALWLCMCLCPWMLCFCNLFCFHWWVIFLSCLEQLDSQNKDKRRLRNWKQICWWYKIGPRGPEGTTSPDCLCPGPRAQAPFQLFISYWISWGESSLILSFYEMFLLQNVSLCAVAGVLLTFGRWGRGCASCESKAGHRGTIALHNGN